MPELWEAVSPRVGDDLRAVTRYGATAFETRTRDDVRAAYTTEEDRSVADDAIVDQSRLAATESAFEAGPLCAIVRVLGDALVLSRLASLAAKSGVIVSIQRGGETASIADVEWCTEYLDEEVAPRLR